ncbi:17424_t:CDS:2, partial [Dentiscutata heterogama]
MSLFETEGSEFRNRYLCNRLQNNPLENNPFQNNFQLQYHINELQRGLYYQQLVNVFRQLNINENINKNIIEHKNKEMNNQIHEDFSYDDKNNSRQEMAFTYIVLWRAQPQKKVSKLVDANPLPAQFKDIQPLICRQSNEKPPNAPSLDNQQQILNQFSEYIGSADRIPTVAQDTANRAILDSTEKNLRTNYNEFKNNRNLKSYIVVLKKQLIGIHDLQTRLGGKWDIKQNNQIEPKVVTGNIDPKDPTQHLYRGPASDQPYLLGFSTEGKGHVILSIGLPKIADNIVTTVLEVGSGLNDALYQSLSINNATSEILKGIIWVGYDAPESPVDVDIDFFTDVLDFGLTKLSIASAVAAGSVLNLFQQGLITIHKGTALHITVVGHSYGSDVVVETTMNGLKLVADDIILIASPGVPVDHVSQIANNIVSSNPGSRIPKTQVWASRIGKDLICCISNSLGTDIISKSFGASVFFSKPRDDHSGY